MAAHTTTANPQRTGGSEMKQRSGEDEVLQPLEDLMNYARKYAREQPEMAALWCFGIGFVLGWKLKPW
jgi:hypothetical protein